MGKEVVQATEKQLALLRASGSTNLEESMDATMKIARALELPLRQGILSGNITGNIFESIKLDINATSEFPLDFVAPGTESEYVAYTIPDSGYMPQLHIEGDYVQVPIYRIGFAIDWLLKYAKYARWDVIARKGEVFRAAFTKKINDDAWHTLLAAGVDRNIIVLDSSAAQGQFTKRLVSLGKLVMRRNGGGNSASNNRGKMTDMYTSPENFEDIRNWNVDQIDEVTRRQIFLAEDGVMSRLFGVNLHDLDELGVGQEYQTYFTSTLGGTMPTAGGHQDVEISVGLDLSKRRSFVMPVRETMEMFPDPTLHRQWKAGVYGASELGLACLDNRDAILLSN